MDPHEIIRGSVFQAPGSCPFIITPWQAQVKLTSLDHFTCGRCPTDLAEDRKDVYSEYTLLPSFPGIQLDKTDVEIVKACAFMEGMDALVAVGSKQGIWIWREVQ